CDLSFELAAGCLAALLGRSGAGKSTLLRCAVGLEPFETGIIEVDGIAVRGTAESSAQERAAALRRIRERVGLVFQNFELFPHLSVLENCVLAPMRVKGKPRTAATSRAHELLGQLGLAGLADALPERLSGGQRQRVAIARALALEPRVVFYDEPT